MYLTWGYNLSNAFQVYLGVVVVEGGVLSLCSIHGWKQTARTLQTAPTPTDIITAVAHNSEQGMHIVQFTTINYSVQSQQQHSRPRLAGWLQ